MELALEIQTALSPINSELDMCSYQFFFTITNTIISKNIDYYS